MTRKKIAKEIIISLILITIMFLGFFGLSFLSSNIFEEKENISNEIAELSEQIKNINPLQKLWYDLVKADKFNISFEKFNLQYNGIEKREFLYNLAKNNEFYNGSYDDFNIKYFPNESALKYAYELAKDKQNSSFTSEYALKMEKYNHNLSFSNFKDSIIGDNNLTKKTHELFVLDGYNGGYQDFRNLMSKNVFDTIITINYIDSKTQLISKLETRREKLNESYFNINNSKIIKFLAFILLTLYLLRLLIYLLKWSLKTIKTNANTL